MLLRKDAESHFRFVIKTYIPTQKYVFGWANILEIREIQFGFRREVNLICFSEWLRKLFYINTPLLEILYLHLISFKYFVAEF